MAERATTTTASPGKRGVGRPRQFDDTSERRLILDAAYRVMRERPDDLTIAGVLDSAGVSTRAFYRHFDSKDALLREMYLRDARWAASRLGRRLARASTPRQAVEWWIDEIYGFTRDARRAERVTVLSSIAGSRAEGVESAALEARSLLIESLLAAIADGRATGAFRSVDVAAAAELVAAAAMHAAGLAAPYRGAVPLDQATTTEFCLSAIGA